MTTYVLDASAWIKRYAAEPGSAAVDELFTSGVRLVASALAEVEVRCTLTRAWRAGALTTQSLDRLLTQLDQDAETVAAVDAGREVAEIARALARATALRGADIVHLASALLVRAHVTDDVVLVTSDQELGDAATLTRLTVMDPAAAR